MCFQELPFDAASLMPFVVVLPGEMQEALQYFAYRVTSAEPAPTKDNAGAIKLTLDRLNIRIALRSGGVSISEQLSRAGDHPTWADLLVQDDEDEDEPVIEYLHKCAFRSVPTDHEDRPDIRILLAVLKDAQSKVLERIVAVRTPRGCCHFGFGYHSRTIC